MLLHCPLGQRERGRNGGVALALRYLAKDLEFARAQRVHAGPSSPVRAHQVPHYDRVYHRLAGRHPTHGVRELCDPDHTLLEKVPPPGGAPLEQPRA